MGTFSKEEKRKYLLKKHMKDHLFEYILDFIGPILLTALILYLCHAKEFLYGIVLATFYSIGRIIFRIYYYKKDFIDIDIKS